ncbi:MAG: hypothetical protein AAFO75_06130 [Pseudomonadota bacterium]
MAKAFWIFMGAVLFLGAVGFLGYRYTQSPDLISKYERMMAPEEVSEAKPKTRSVTPAPVAPDDGPQVDYSRQADSPLPSSETSRFDKIRILEIALDAGNILVGLIGIYLAVSGMRMRRETQV